MLCSQLLVVPKEAISAHSETLRSMRCSIKIAYGISDNHYKGSKTEPLAGTGQGSGASPAVLLSICRVLLKSYVGNKTKNCIRFQDPTRSIHSRRRADAFWEDTSIGFNWNTNRPAMNITFIMKTLSECAQLWETDTIICIQRSIRTFKTLLPTDSLEVGQSRIT